MIRRIIKASGIERTFLTVISGLVFGIVVIFTFFSYQVFSSELRQEFEIRGSSLTKRFASDCRLGVMLKSENMLIMPFAAFSAEEDVVDMAVYDLDGKPIKTYQKAGQAASRDAKLDPFLMKRLKAGAEMAVMPGNEVYQFCIPIRMASAAADEVIKTEDHKTMGYARIGFAPRRFNESLAQTLRISVVFGAIMLFCSVVIATLLARRISLPIITISEKMEAIGTGEGDLTQRLSVRGEDEMGRLAAGFNNFVKALSGIIREIAAASPKLFDQAQKLVSTSELLTNEAEGNIQSVQQIALGLGRQLQQIHQVMSEAKSAQSIARETVESATRSRNSSNKIMTLSEEGKTESRAAIENVELLVRDIEHLVERITALGAETKKVTHISETINSLSKQTNMLALNASIEAARAGTAGSGFRIIANEVSKLAEMSRFQAEEIGKLISDIVGKIGIMVQDVERTQQGIVQSKDVLLGAAERLGNISGEMAGTVKDIEIIARKGEVNQKSVNQLVAILEEVVGETQKSSASAEGVSTSIEGQRTEYDKLLNSTQVLKNLSDNLQRLVGHFKV